MKKYLLVVIFALCAVQSISAMAADFSFTGSLDNDDQVQLFDFTVGSISTVTMRTYSYAGGVNADGATIPAGGFDPILALFDAGENLIDQNDDGVGVPADPVTGSSYDTLLEVELTPGNYTVAVSQYANFANGPTLSDGFAGSGTLGFVDSNGATRTSAWAFDLLNVADAEVIEPEPAVPVPTLRSTALVILVLLLGMFGAWYTRKDRQII
jgi:hypothetical protein